MKANRQGLPILLICLLLAGCAQNLPPTSPRGQEEQGRVPPIEGWLSSSLNEGEYRIQMDWGVVGGGAEVVQFETRQSDPTKPIVGHLYLEYESDGIANVCASLHVGSSGGEVTNTADRPAFRTSLVPSEGPQVLSNAGGLAVGTAPMTEINPPVIMGFDRVEDPGVAKAGRFWLSSDAAFSARPVWRGNMTCIHSFADFSTGEYTQTTVGLSGQDLAESWSEGGPQLLWLAYQSNLDYDIRIADKAGTKWSDQKSIDGTAPEEHRLFLLDFPQVSLNVPTFRGQGSSFFYAVHLDLPDALVPYLVDSGRYELLAK